MPRPCQVELRRDFRVPCPTHTTDKDEGVREAAATSLGDLGAPARAAIPALKKLLADPDADVKEAVEEALEKLQAPETPRPKKTESTRKPGKK
jgi:HEAT repeat protein